MRRAAIAAVSIVLVPSAFALSACTSSASPSPTTAKSPSAAAPTGGAQGAGNAGLTSAEVNAAIDAAAKDATALRVAGSVESDGQSITMNLQLNKNSGSGTIGISGATIPFIAVGKNAYIQFTPSLLALSGESTSAGGQLLLNKWVSTTSQAGSSIAGSLTTFMSLSAFVGQVTSPSSSSQLTADGTSTVHGQAVADYIEKDSSSSAPVTTEELSIAATGPALPVQEVGMGSGNSGTVTFTWNQPTTVTLPPASQIYVVPAS